MDLLHVSATLSSVARVINSRPLGLSSQQEGEFRPITPGDLLVSRPMKTDSQIIQQVELLDKKQELAYIQAMKKDNMAIFGAWQEQWLTSVFPSMVERHKWREATENLSVGQVGMLRYDTKYGADTFKLARVTQLIPDDQSIVRTVEVEIGITKGKLSAVKHRLIIPTSRFCPLATVNTDSDTNQVPQTALHREGRSSNQLPNSAPTPTNQAINSC